MENKVMKFGYEDTDKKIEINLYGLDFEIKDLESVERLEKLDRNNENEIEAQLESILGIGAIDKINRKRKNDGYCKLDLNIELNILGCIFEAYAKSMTEGFVGKVTNTVSDINNNINRNMNFNREQRRSYNNRRNRNYRRY